jgi:iron-sulfur cluster repair protein YtfE (RIC family)
MVATRSSRQAIWAFIEHEHRELVRGINRVHEVACEVGRRASPELSVHVLDVLRWFDTTLEPHMAWEEAMLYPEIDDRAGTPWATRATRFDHEQIREMAARLRAGQHALAHPAGTEPAVDLRCRLFGLEALVRAHVEREERFLIPILSEDRPGTPIDVGPPGVRVPAIPRSRA